MKGLVETKLPRLYHLLLTNELPDNVSIDGTSWRIEMCSDLEVRPWNVKLVSQEFFCYTSVGGKQKEGT